MYFSSRIVLAFVLTGAILAVLLHGKFNWSCCKCPFFSYDADVDSVGKPSHSSVSAESQLLTDQINNLIHSLNEGKTDLVLPPLDPLFLESMIVEQGTNILPTGLKLTNVTIRGLSKLRVSNVKNDWKRFEITYFLDKLDIEGNYDFNANLMIMPITVNGPCTFLYENMTVTLSANLKQETKDGKVFYQVENMLIFDDPESFSMNVRNLISGEEAFDSIMNKFLNKNFKHIIAETMSKAHKELYIGIANMILSQIPLNSLILQKNANEFNL